VKIIQKIARKKESKTIVNCRLDCSLLKGGVPFDILFDIMVLDFMSMPSIARTVFANLPHHITQRGNRREPVFFKDEDRIFYLSLLKDYRKIKGVYVCRGRCRNIEY
jgi:hypothetical protein